MDCWQILQIEPTNDTRAIKRAYAKLLKTTRPDDDAAAYQALREAFDEALAIAPHLLADENGDDWSFDDNADSETPPPDPLAADYADSREQQPETPDSGFQAAFAPPADTPPAPAEYSEQDFSGCPEAGLENETEAQAARQPEGVQSAFADPDIEEDFWGIWDNIEQMLTHYYHTGGGNALAQAWPQIRDALDGLPLGGSDEASSLCAAFLRHYRIEHPEVWTQWADYFGWSEDVRGATLTPEELQQLVLHRRSMARLERRRHNRYGGKTAQENGKRQPENTGFGDSYDPDSPYPDPPPADDTPLLVSQLEYLYAEGGSALLLARWPQISGALDNLPLGAAEQASHAFAGFLRRHRIVHPLLWVQWADYFRWDEDVRGEVLSLEESQRLAQFRRHAALLAGYRHVRPDAGSAPDIGEDWRLTRAFNRFLGSHPSGWRSFQAACAAALLWPELDRETDESDRADIAVSHPPLARLLLCNRPWRIAMLLAVLALCLAAAAGIRGEPVMGAADVRFDFVAAGRVRRHLRLSFWLRPAAQYAVFGRCAEQMARNQIPAAHHPAVSVYPAGAGGGALCLRAGRFMGAVAADIQLRHRLVLLLFLPDTQQSRRLVGLGLAGGLPGGYPRGTLAAEPRSARRLAAARIRQHAAGTAVVRCRTLAADEPKRTL